MLKVRSSFDSNTKVTADQISDAQWPSALELDNLYSSPSQVNVLLHNGIQEAQKGHYTTAQAYFNQVVRLEPQNEMGLLWLGYLAEDPVEAANYFDHLLRLNPHHALARQYLEKALLKAKTYNALKINSTTTGTLPPTPAKKLSSKIPWIGDLLLENGVISAEQLMFALERQQELASKKKWKPLGEILIQFGYVKRYQIEDALYYQKVKRTL